MANISVDTDAMRHLADLFYHIDETLEDTSLPQIRSGIANLEHHWHGASRARYEELFQKWEHHAIKLAELGEEIAKHLRHTADAYEQADQGNYDSD